MIEDFNKLSFFELQKLNREELNDYYIRLRKYLYEKDELVKNVQLRKKLYFLTSKILKAQRLVNQNKITIINDLNKKTDKPKIFAVTHIGKFDIEIILEALKEHAYVLLGDPKYMYKTIDGIFLWLNGVIYVDVYNKEDRKIAKETAIKVLQKGGNVMWFIEGIWNLSPNQIVHPSSFGVIEGVLRGEAVIVPIAIEQYDKNFCVNIGSAIDYQPNQNCYKEEFLTKKMAIRDLRDKLAMLKWGIWKEQGIFKREEIPNDYYQQYVETRLNEWPHFTIEEIKERIFKEEDIFEFEEVFEFLQKIEYNDNNAFLLKKI